jgi:restriction endonuclease S subunit
MTPSDVKIVADNINDFIDVSDGINRLRKEVLTLAVSGGFSSDGSKSWNMSKLGEICTVKKGKRPELFEAQEEGMLPYLEAKFIRGIKPAKFAYTSDKNSVIVDNDDLIIICDGSNSGEFFAGVSGVLASTMGVLTFNKEIVSKAYLELFLKSNFDLFNKTRKGAAIPHLDFNLFNSLEFSIPSIEEQHRIVDRVESVMKQLDELESQKKERDQVRSRLTKSAMQALGSTDSKIALEQLIELIKTPQDIKELESAILNLAVTGNLTKQDLKDGNAVDLIQDVLNIKQELIKLKRLKSNKQNNISLTIRDFSLPKNWTWVKGDEIFFITKLAGFEYTEHIKLSDVGDVPVIRAQNVRKFNIDKSSLKYISSEISALLNRSALTKPCLLVTFIGAGIGEVALFEERIRWHLAPNVAKMELFENCDSILNLKYFNYYLASGYGQREIFKHMKETAQPSLSMGTIRDIDYPIPPTDEQNRIVKKVEELMVLVNQLKEVMGAK